MLRSILTKLGLNDQYLDRYSHTNNGGVKGHDGVTGVKKVFSPKLLFFVQITWYDHVTHICSSARYPLQKLSVKKLPGVIWGHRGQKFILTKIVISPTDYMVW